MNFGWARDLSDEDWCAFLSGELKIPGRLAPPMASQEMQMLLAGQSGRALMRSALTFVNEIKRTIQEVGGELGLHTSVLEIGCGWGATFRTFLRDLDPLKFIGAEPEPSFLSVAKETLPFCNFTIIPNLPPYTFETARFDLVYLHSIFTHLSESAFLRILGEIERIAKPGAFIAFTVLPLKDFAWLSRVSADELRPKAEAGEFLYLPIGGGTDVMPSDIYGWALITREYLDRGLQSRPFEIIRMGDMEGHPQTFVMMRKIMGN